MKVGLVFGGSGPEHEASLSSARAVLDHVNHQRYEILQFGITKTGDWLAGQHSWAYLYAASDQKLLPTLIQSFPVRPPPMIVRRTVDELAETYLSDVDVIFPLVHGSGGEDGTLQGLFDHIARPYVGCDAFSSSIAFNKWTTKRLAQRLGIASARAVLITSDVCDDRVASIVAEKLSDERLVVKPAASGSSFGVQLAVGSANVVPAVHNARKYSKDVIVEEFLDVEEIFVGVVGNGDDLKIAPPALDGSRIGRISTYHDKYINREIKVQCPSGLGRIVDEEAQRIAAQIYRALGCSGLARIDIFYSPISKKLFLNEVNTMPALATDCTFPTGMAALGLPFAVLLDRIIQLSLERSKCLNPPSPPLLDTTATYYHV